MKRRLRRKRNRLPKSSQPPTAPAPMADSLLVMQELNNSLLSGDSMEKTSRQALERVLHDQVTKTQLHMSALTIHKQMRHAKLLGALDFVVDYLSDPGYLKAALRDPESAVKLLKVLHKIDMDNTKFILEMCFVGSGKKGEGLDPQKGMEAIIGLANTVPENLPPALQDPSRLRNFRSLLQTIIDSASGKSMPEPPKVTSRVKTAEVIDVEVLDGN